MSNQAWAWVLFNVFVVGMLVLDALVFHRRAHQVKIKEAIGWSIFWISLAVIFNLGIYFIQGKEKALQFTAGYLIEESLSVDNLFVFLLIFSYFKVQHKYQHKILFWGILGAQAMRAFFIISGVALIHRFHWIIYFFGGLLVISGLKLFFEKEKDIHLEKNIIIKICRRIIPSTKDYHEDKFWVKENGLWLATPLFFVLVVIDVVDLVFAIDSIPAVLAVSKDSFIVYTSNIFAILGLRALYFALSGLLELFHYLHYGLGMILVFVGVKMLVEGFYEIPLAVALGFIVVVLVGSVILSLILPSNPQKVRH